MVAFMELLEVRNPLFKGCLFKTDVDIKNYGALWKEKYKKVENRSFFSFARGEGLLNIVRKVRIEMENLQTDLLIFWTFEIYIFHFLY